MQLSVLSLPLFEFHYNILFCNLFLGRHQEHRKGLPIARSDGLSGGLVPTDARLLAETAYASAQFRQHRDDARQFGPAAANTAADSQLTRSGWRSNGSSWQRWTGHRWWHWHCWRKRRRRKYRYDGHGRSGAEHTDGWNVQSACCIREH